MSEESKKQEFESEHSEYLPLKGLNVADFSVGMAGALVAKFLAEAGAEVQRMEPLGGDPFYKVYEAYSTWRSVLRSSGSFSPEREKALLASADICLVGGEDFPGRLSRHDGEILSGEYPRLIVLDISAQLPDEDVAPLHGADILVQARSGLVFEVYPDHPALLGFVPSAYGASLNGLVALSAALYQRENYGHGQLVRVGLLEGAMAWPLAFWGRAENETPSYTFKAPRGARQPIFKTNDNVYIHIVLGSAGSKYKVYKVLGIDDPSIKPNDSGLPNPKDGPDKYFGEIDLLAAHVVKRECAELLAAFCEIGVVCERVLGPAEYWADPQAIENEIVVRSSSGTEYIGQPIKWTFVGGEAKHAAVNYDDLPLSGINVVDFGAFVAGPALSVGLRDLGAEVIKVEPPAGDPLRKLHNFYAASNRGKRSISLDLKNTVGADVARHLIRRADVVCSNFRNGVAERLGIDQATIHREQPEKIVVVNAGYGIAGPSADRPAFDPCMQAICGLEARAGGVGNQPRFNPMMMVDLCGALLGEIGTLLALYRRARDGSGASVVVPLLNAGLFLMSDVIRTRDGTVIGPVTLLGDQTGYHPAEKIYKTNDGWIAVSARGEAASFAFGKVFGVPNIERKVRADWGRDEVEFLSAAISSLSSSEVLMILEKARVPAEVCRKDGAVEFMSDDKNVRSGTVYESSRPETGITRGIGVLFRMGVSSLKPNGEVQGLGHDTMAILTELGLTPSSI